MAQTFNPKNKDIKVYVNGEIVHRDKAKVSVFDSVVQGGDAVWEGLRVYNGKIFCLNEHLARLNASAKTLDFKNIPTTGEIKEAIFSTLHANGMMNHTHIRLTLSRGEKVTSGMDPQLNQKGCTLVVLAEWKDPIYPESGIELITSSIRRNNPQFLDSKIHHNNLLNNILAKIEANHAGADDAIMLDANGYVSETNATNIFLAKNNELITPTADSCLPGITRSQVIRLANENNIALQERNISVHECYNADEVFTTGTMGELTTVNKIDGREIKPSINKSVLTELRTKFIDLVKKEGEVIPG